MAVVQYKTPGVYVEELDAFPPSIVGVETAVPVFIGYTQKAEKSGRSLLQRAVRISSMAEYKPIFGGAYPYQFAIKPAPLTIATVTAAEAAAKTLDEAKSQAVGLAIPPDTAKDDAKTLADKAANKAKADDATRAAERANAYAAKLRQDFENTQAGKDEKAAKALADDLEALKKSAPLDPTIKEKEENAKKARQTATDSASAAAKSVSPDVRIGDNSYELAIVENFYLYNCLRLFYANGGGSCYVISVGSYDDSLDYKALSLGLANVRDLVGPTMLVIPEAVNLSPANHQTLAAEMLTQCFDRQDRVAIFDVPDMAAPADFGAAIKNFRDEVVGRPSLHLKYGMAYAPFLHTSIVDPSEVSFKNFDDNSRGVIETLIEGEAKRLYPTADTAELKKAFLEQLSELDVIADPDEKARRFAQLNQNLVAQIPVFKDIYATMATKLGTLPPSAAMAGIYTQNDTLRGVWNAPANVGMVSVTGPTVAISTEVQNDLNMPISGLAINAIRDFVGRGTLVWGARTLDGNSNDWRYIQVRRALIYIEQSVELALNKFVFEPNVAQTWVTVTSMVGTFLRGVWQAGGLMGASPAEAFSVQCGLGSTMTAQDVLEGKMIVQIKLTMIHPAEFIVLTFQQQMQGGA
jgi:phage tail sheath protein FI